jgi:hypothetical protein
MSNARNLANLLGAGTTIATASIADDAITAAKIDDDGTGFTFGDISVAGTVVGDSFTQFDKLKLDGSSVATVTVNSAVSASATIVVDGVSGTIAVGMVVNVSDTTVRSITDAASQSAISVDDTLTITAVASQTSFTVSEAVTIADNVVLILTADENQGFVLDASAASTDVGEEILFEDATGDGSIVLNTAGAVLQVKSTTITNTTATTTSASANDIAGMSVSITPKSVTSNMYISVSLYYGHNSNPYGAVFLLRNNELVTRGDKAGAANTQQVTFSLTATEDAYRVTPASFTFLDTTVDTTEELTYKLQWNSYNNIALYLNRPHTMDNNTYSMTTTSTITVMEIGG